MDEFSTLLQEIQFSERFRGYDPDEVDTYMHTVAKAAAQMQGRLRELQQRVEAAESRLGAAHPGAETEETLTRTLLLAQRTADAAIAEAEAEAARMTAEAQHRTSIVVAEAEENGAAILTAAQSQASALMADADSAASTRLRDAQDRSARILAEAEIDRRRILAEATTEAAASAAADRDRLLAEVDELETRRAGLRFDIDGLDRQVADQRSQLQRSLTALRSLIEDPANFGLADPPVGEVEDSSIGTGPKVSSPLQETVTGRGFEREEPLSGSGFEREEPLSGSGFEREEPLSRSGFEREEDELGSWPDPIAEEFSTVSPAMAEAAPGQAIPLIDDFVDPDDREPVETVPEADASTIDDLVDPDDDREPVETVPEADASTTDDARIDLVDIEGTDDAEIDLVDIEGTDETEVDLLGEPPIDAEIVSETGPRLDQGHSGGGSAVESDVRTAPPRFLTVADLDESSRSDPIAVEPEPESDEVSVAAPESDEVSVAAPESDEVSVAAPESESLAVEPESPRLGAGGLIDFEEIEAQPVTQPVPVTEPDHPSLFGAEPAAPPTTDDEFLAQLRQAVSSDDHPLPEDDNDDALSAFFEADDEERQRGWFGRKR